MKSPNQGAKLSFKQLKANWENKMRNSNDSQKLDLNRPAPLLFGSSDSNTTKAESDEEAATPLAKIPMLQRKNAFIRKRSFRTIFTIASMVSAYAMVWKWS